MLITIRSQLTNDLINGIKNHLFTTDRILPIKSKCKNASYGAQILAHFRIVSCSPKVHMYIFLKAVKSQLSKREFVPCFILFQLHSTLQVQSNSSKKKPTCHCLTLTPRCLLSDAVLGKHQDAQRFVLLQRIRQFDDALLILWQIVNPDFNACYVQWDVPK